MMTEKRNSTAEKYIRVASKPRFFTFLAVLALLVVLITSSLVFHAYHVHGEYRNSYYVNNTLNA